MSSITQKSESIQIQPSINLQNGDIHLSKISQLPDSIINIICSFFSYDELTLSASKVVKQPSISPIPRSSTTPSITGLPLPSLPSTEALAAPVEVSESNTILSGLTFDPRQKNASFEQVEICTKIFHSIYNKENNYRFIQPSEAYSTEGSISTVLKGIRPFAHINEISSCAYIVLPLERHPKIWN